MMREVSVSMPARRPVSYQDVLNAPPHLIAEIIDGELFLQPRPASAHAETSAHMVGTLAPLWGRGGGGSPGKWRILFEPELHLEEQVLVPDIAGWRTERMPRNPHKAFITLQPDCVCEILSPSTAKVDRTSKMRIYARHRVQHVWLVDPISQLLEVYQLAGEFWQRTHALEGIERHRIPPFEEIEFELSQWWADLEEPEENEGG